MALPFLLGLSKTARAAFPIIQGGVARGLSGRGIERALKGAGLGIRRETLLDIIRREQGITRAGAQLRFLGTNRLPNIQRLPTALTRIRRRFSFTVQVTGRSIDSGLELLQNITVSTDTVLTRNELERIAEDAVLANQIRYGLDITSALLIGGKRAGAAGVL